MPLTETEITVLGNAVLSEVMKLSIPTIRTVAAAAGIDAGRIPARSEAKGGSGSRAEVAPALFALFNELALERKIRALSILAQKIVESRPSAQAGLTTLLAQHGYQFVDGSFVPVGLIDEREAHYLPASSGSELAKAITRLSEKDESGAITAACGAVDIATNAACERFGLGQPPVSFQAKVNTVIQSLKIFEDMEAELVAINVKHEDAREIVDEMREATKHAANALQTIRRSMGDVHGTKPAFTKMVYDSIKLSSAICGLLEGKV